MRDFSLDIYRELLECLQQNGYQLIGYAEYLKSQEPRAKSQEPRVKSDDKFVILRHDVDAKHSNALRMAQLEHALGVKASYYFRKSKRLPGMNYYSGSMSEPEILRAVVRLGHELGYHYEDLSACDGDANQAWSHFKIWLAYFRQFYPVETISAHGSPRSQWDNKELWKQYDYKSLGIIGEPYLDTDFSDVLYLTDTGRCWDGYKMSVRDKIPEYQDAWTKQGLTWHSTKQIIKAIKANKLPAHVMLTTHPQRWTNNRGEWWKELIGQSAKNVAKRILLGIKN